MFEIIETEETRKEIDALKNVDVSWISVVQHGANREPWKIMKTEEGMNEDNVIQSVLVPKGADLEASAQKDNLGWLTEVQKSEAVKYESYTEFVQAPKTSFENLSFKIVSKEDGIVAVVGNLKPDKKKAAGNLLTLPENPMYMPVSTELIPVNQTAGDVFYKEAYGMMDTVEGIMRQAAYTPADRKAAVLKSGGAFLTFLEMWTDALADMDTTKTKFDVSILSDIIREQKKDGGNEDMDKETMVAAFTEALAPVVKTLEELKTQKAETPPPVVEPPKTEPVVVVAPAAAPVVDPKVAGLEAQIAELTKSVADLTAQKEHEPVTDPVTGTADLPDGEGDEGLGKSAVGHTGEAEALPPDKRAGVFDGIIFDPKKVRSAYSH
jgi:hypothetical protein